MRFTEDDLRAAAAGGALEQEQLDKLLAFLRARPGVAAQPLAAQFDLVHVLWYAGALIVIGAMGMFSTVAFSQMGGRALTATAIAYAIGFVAAGHHVWHNRNLKIPGGLL